MIPRNTTIPNKKGDKLAVYMDPKAELEVITSASYDHLIGKHNKHARLAITRIKNLTSVRQQINLLIWLDIDANCMLSQHIEITGCNHHDFDIQSKALSTIIESILACENIRWNTYLQ